MISRQLTEVNVWVYVCTYSLALPSKGLRSRDIPVTMSIPTAQILASKYDYPLKETFLGERADSSAGAGKV